MGVYILIYECITLQSSNVFRFNRQYFIKLLSGITPTLSLHIHLT
ncbi:hypothetical protein EVA_05449 [gut metagenome]|uniref:Uncharacterized protein n=1 Tax=gut metagenome TaxID=749906 RepID=J9GGD2_9ZZZZ